MTAADRGVGLADQSADAESILAWFRRMRENEPVSHDEKAGGWHVFRYADTAQVLNDPDSFSSDFRPLLPAREDVDRFVRGNVMRNDPPQHRKLRTLVSKAFTPRMINQLAPRIATIATELMDAMHGAEQIDLVSDLAYSLPVTVIAELLGIPLEDRSMFRRWADGLVESANQTSFMPNALRPEDAQRIAATAQVMREMNSYCLDHVRSSRVQPRDDLTSRLVDAEIDGERLDDEQIVGFVGLLLVAGHITTTLLIGNAVLCLHEHPEATATLRADPTGLPTALEEVLRYRTPLSRFMRRTTGPVRLGEHVIPEGQLVFAWQASANRDERQFPQPDRFDILRDPNAHLSFGHGIHFCLGAPLARLEARIALEIMLTRWSDLSVAPGAEFHDARRIIGASRLPLQVSWA